MLPDYVDTKQRLQDVLTRWLRKRVRTHLGPLGEIPRYYVFEGSGTSVIRPDNREDVTKMRRLGSELTVKLDEVPNLTPAEILKRLDRAAQEIADNIARHAYGTMSEVTERVGNIVRTTGKITPEAILEAFEKIEIVFDEHGEAEMPSIHMHPDAIETLKEALEKLQNVTEYRQRFDEIMLEKKRRWRVREADRKLVG